MGDFDRVLKENIEAIFLPLMEKLLGISVSEISEVKDDIQQTIERKPDFLKRIIDKNGKEFILHLEFQTTNDPEMVYRMAEYKAFLQRKHKLYVIQFVIYLGADRPTMQTTLSEDEQITGFVLKDIHDFSTEKTLNSDIPEEIILSILTDYSKADVSEVVRRIIEKLQQATKNETQLRRSIEQLLILSRLRKLDKETEKQVRAMPITYDIKTDRLYKKGRKEGKQEGISSIIKKALTQGILTVEQIAEMAGVSIDEVLSVQSKMKK